MQVHCSLSLSEMLSLSEVFEVPTKENAFH